VALICGLNLDGGIVNTPCLWLDVVKKTSPFLILLLLMAATSAQAQPLLEESFEGAAFPPAGWTETPVHVAGYGTDPDWYRHEGTDVSSYNPAFEGPAYDGTFLACFNSRIASGFCASSRLETPPLDLSAAASANLSYWMLHDPMWGWGDCWEVIQVQIDPGTGVWQNLGEHNIRQTEGDWFWEEMVLSLDAFIGLPAVRIGFLAVSDQGENMHIDLVSVTVLDGDSEAPLLAEIHGARTPATAPLHLRLLIEDRSPVAEQVTGELSFDGFATSEPFLLDLAGEIEPLPAARRFWYAGTTPVQDNPADGEVRFLLADLHDNSDWTSPQPVTWYAPLLSLDEDFEAFPDFSLDLTPFTQIDRDSSGTWGIPYVSFPNDGYVGSFIIFNPHETDPPAIYAPYMPHSGDHAAVCFTAFDGNDDWLVTPAIIAQPGLKFSLWARTPDTSWDLERFRVLVSTTVDHDTSAFELVPSEHYVAGQDFVEPPFPWTRYEFDLSPWAEAEQGYLFVAVNGVSPYITLLGLFIDDLQVWSPVSAVDDPDGELPNALHRLALSAAPNPFNPATSIDFTTTTPGEATVTIYDLTGKLVKRLVAGPYQPGRHSVIWKGRDGSGREMPSGTYLVQLKTDAGVLAKKVMLVR